MGSGQVSVNGNLHVLDFALVMKRIYPSNAPKVVVPIIKGGGVNLRKR